MADDFQHKPFRVLPEHGIVASVVLWELLRRMQHWRTECLDLGMHGVHSCTGLDHKGQVL